MSITEGMMSSNRSDWETPGELFDVLDREFRFTVDVCATENNSKCKRFFTPEQNGLIQPWGGERCWCNPPYGREYPKWVHKAYKEMLMNNTLSVVLIPARTDTITFHRYIMCASEIRFIKGRISFLVPDQDKPSPAPFPSMVVVFKKASGGVHGAPSISTLDIP